MVVKILYEYASHHDNNVAMTLPKPVVAAVLQLLLQLLERFHGFYWTIGELKQYLNIGGLLGLTKEMFLERIHLVSGQRGEEIVYGNQWHGHGV